MRAAQKGDAQAFRELVVKYQRRVYQLALGMTKDPDDAMDISQETFVRVHRYLPTFKGDSSFFTWTYRIATNDFLASGSDGYVEFRGTPRLLPDDDCSYIRRHDGFDASGRTWRPPSGGPFDCRRGKERIC